LAASRSTSAPSTSSLAPRRISFARINEPLEVPDLLALQTASFKWLIGSDEWRATAEQGSLSGLEEILEEISPIRDFSDTMSLEFREPKLMDPPHSIEECKDKDMTYSAPLFVIAEFTNNETGEIKSQTVFMGDFPLMTPNGTFIINGTERVPARPVAGRLL
jgi:DNA-directed RNA polymerase subunit beta